MHRWTLIAVMLLAPASAWAQDDVAALKAENEALKQRVAQLERELAALKQQLDTKTTQVQTLSAEKQELAQEVQAEQQRTQRLYTAKRYNAANNTTTVIGAASQLAFDRGAAGEHWMGFEFEHPGQTVNQPVANARMRVQTMFSDGGYRSAKSALLTVDGESTTVPIADYDSLSRMVGGIRNRRRVYDESFDLVISRQWVEAIGNGKVVTFKIGRNTAELSIEQIQTVASVASQMRGE